MLLAQGRIVFDEDVDLEGATIHVRLEDVGRADARAPVIARTVVPSPVSPASSRGVPFSLEGPPLDPRGQYGLRVHVDLDGDGQVGRGDFVSTTTYPVEAARLPVELSVWVHRVR